MYPFEYDIKQNIEIAIIYYLHILYHKISFLKVRKYSKFRLFYLIIYYIDKDIFLMIWYSIENKLNEIILFLRK